MASLDVLIYRDFTNNTGDGITIGDRAEKVFGQGFDGLRVVAIGPGIHAGRTTIVLAHRADPMPEIQALLDGREQRRVES